MKRGIFIVHNSEIVRSGLALIIRKYFNIEITQLTALEDLNSFAYISNSNIILFTELEKTARKNLINKIKGSNVVHVIGIKGSIENNSNISTDYNISLQTPNSKIQEIISTIFKSSNSRQAEKDKNGELTTRERDVLKLVALGHSNKDIADQLFISVHTVISHRKNITEKLGIKSISGLTVYAILNKLIDTETINPENLI